MNSLFAITPYVISLFRKDDHLPLDDILCSVNLFCILEQLSKTANKGSDKKAAKLAIQIINYSEIKLIEIDSGHTDDAIISYSKTNNNLVLTNDSELKKRLTEENIKVLTLSNNKKLITS